MLNQTKTVSCSVGIPLGVPEAWELLWRPEGKQLWLGKDMSLETHAGGRVIQSLEGFPWRNGVVIEWKEEGAILLRMECPDLWRQSRPSRVSIRLLSSGKNSSVIRVEETGIPFDQGVFINSYWMSLLSRIKKLALWIQDRRDKPRQAVVLIHGIGEQQPGEMLRGFLESGVLGNLRGISTWIKPDRLSESFELRRASLAGSASQPLTEIYECYWAHVIRDTTFEQVLSWMAGILLRRKVPPKLLVSWLVTWLILLLTALGFSAYLSGKDDSRWVIPPLIALSLGIAWNNLVKPIGTNVVGDAARYLQPHPSNIAHRQAIRSAGVNLIEKLHQSGRFDRIVVVGHSLGSVIAYDIIVHSWIRLHRRHRRPQRPRFQDFKAVEIQAQSLSVNTLEAQNLQHQAWRQLRINTQPWLITDLVTLGSPLTYADFLIENSQNRFHQAVADRILPTCPPRMEIIHGKPQMMFPVPRGEDPINSTKTNLSVLHHAAPFAVTRWSNLFFESNWIGLQGDVIGGRVAPLFGNWISDIGMKALPGRLNHTSYWSGESSADHLKALREALKLDSNNDLKNLLRSIPAYALIPEGLSRD